MKPTLRMEHTATTDDIVFHCDHGTTDAHLIDNRGAPALMAAVQMVMARHSTDCACQPKVIIDEWPSMAEALAVTEADLADPGAEAFGEAVNTAAMLAIQTMREYACDGCDPRFATISQLGVMENHVVHKAGCPNEGRHRRRTRVLDFMPGRVS